MTTREILKKLITESGKTNADLAYGLNITPAAVWDRLNSPKTNNLTTNKLVDMLRFLGYDLVIMPHGKAGRIENSYVIDNGEEK